MDELSRFLNDFHFIRPWWLLGLIALVVITYLSRKHSPRHNLDDLVDPHLQAVVVDDPGQQRAGIPGPAGLALALLMTALAGPTWERLPQPLFQLQQGRVVVLNLDVSMDRTDMLPSRLKRAQFKIDDLLASMPGVLTGLVAFAGEAFVVAPLSDDQDTISNLLQSLATDTLPVSGIRAERGLEKAGALLKQVAINAGEIILVTDQASPLAVSRARELAREGVRVSVLEVAPENDTSQRALLKSIARAGEGIATRLMTGDDDIHQLNAALLRWTAQSQSQTSESQRRADQWRDLGPWLLIPALLLASLMFRRGWLSALGLLPAGILAGLLSSPQPASAFDWSTLWERDDQQQWKAAQAYHDGDMHTALQGFTKDRTATGAYNRGNALASSEQLEAALTAYDEALDLRPNFPDARYNRRLVEEALARQSQQNSEAQPGSDNQPQSSEEKDEAGQEQADDSQRRDAQEPDQQSAQTPSQSSPEKENPKKGQDPTETAAEEPAQAEQSEGDQTNQGQADNQIEPDTEIDASVTAKESGPMDEDAQALELMLRQVPDDPGALLRRKFKYQYQNQSQ